MRNGSTQETEFVAMKLDPFINVDKKSSQRMASQRFITKHGWKEIHVTKRIAEGRRRNCESFTSHQFSIMPINRARKNTTQEVASVSR